MRKVKTLSKPKSAFAHNMERNRKDDVAIVVSKDTWLLLEKFRETTHAADYDAVLGKVIRQHLIQHERAKRDIVISEHLDAEMEEVNVRYADELCDAEFALLEEEILRDKYSAKLDVSTIYLDLLWYLCFGDRVKLFKTYLSAKKAYDAENSWRKPSSTRLDAECLT